MSLPFELVEIVVGMLVSDDEHRGYLWVDKRRFSATDKWTPLWALTQVAHIWRVVAMRTMWRVIKVCLPDKDMSSILYLRQLYDHMRLGAVKDYIEEIHVTLPRHRGDQGYSKGDWRRFRAECTKGFSRQDEGSINDTLFERDVLCNLARRLSVHLPHCHRLRSLSWTGWLVPDLVILDNLSRCPKLARILLNLGRVRVDHHDFCRSVNDTKEAAVVLPPTHEPFPALNTIDVAFDTRGALTGSSVRHRDCTSASFVAILIQYRAIPRHFKIGAPSLLYQTCMLPIWACAEEISWSDAMDLRHIEQDDRDRPLRLAKRMRLHRSRFLAIARVLEHARGENEDVPWDKICQTLFDIVHRDATLKSILIPCDIRGTSSTTCISTEKASKAAAATLHTFMPIEMASRAAAAILHTFMPMEMASKVAAAILYTFTQPPSSPQRQQAFVEERKRLLPRLQAICNVSSFKTPLLDSQPLGLLAMERNITTTHGSETGECDVHGKELELGFALPNS